MMRGCEILGRYNSCDSFLDNLCFIVLGITSTEGQETERFLGARKPSTLLVGREDFVVSLWESGKRMLGST
jgi:hypothetical protein